MSGVPVDIQDITEQTAGAKVQAERKTYYSMWHVLVSSNVKTDDLATANEIASCLKTGFASTFRDRPNDVFIIRGGEWGSELIDSLKIQYAAEIGEDPRGGRVHLHALVTVVHHDNVRINGPALQVILREHCMDHPFIKNIFVRVKWVPTSKPLEDYIGKNPLSATTRL